MKNSTSIKASIVITIGLLAGQARAANYTASTQQASGSSWNSAGFWSSGVGAASGNTYEVLSGGRVRSDDTVGAVSAFTGDSLTLDSGGELRFKAYSSASRQNSTYNFNNGGLILNGGLVEAGDAVVTTIGGSIHVTANSSISDSQDAVTIGADTRAFTISAAIDGSGQLTLMHGKTTLANPAGSGSPDFNITSIGNLFSGTWLNTGGWLHGAGNGSLGSGSFVINGSATEQAVFDTDYDLFSAGSLTLANVNSGLLLDQNLTFSAVTIDGTSLAAGSYSVADLTSMGFGANIAGGSDITGTMFLTVTAAPEPSTFALASLGALGALVLRRKRA